MSIKTAQINLPLSTEQASLLLGILDRQIKSIQEEHDTSHSGVDRLLLDSARMNVQALRDHVRTRVPVSIPASGQD